MQHLLFPESFGRFRREYLNRIVPLSLRKADAVIAVSEWERGVAIQEFGLDPARIFAVHHGVSDLVRGAATTPPPHAPGPTSRPYVFMVSTLYGFKNHRRLVQAFAQVVREQQVPHELVLAGGDADVTAKELAELARNEGVSDRLRLLGPVPHDRIPGFVPPRTQWPIRACARPSDTRFSRRLRSAAAS